MSIVILVCFFGGFYWGFNLGHKFPTAQSLVDKVKAWFKTL